MSVSGNSICHVTEQTEDQLPLTENLQFLNQLSKVLQENGRGDL